jgi:hypothetical protein
VCQPGADEIRRVEEVDGARQPVQRQVGQVGDQPQELALLNSEPDSLEIKAGVGGQARQKVAPAGWGKEDELVGCIQRGQRFRQALFVACNASEGIRGTFEEVKADADVFSLLSSS